MPDGSHYIAYAKALHRFLEDVARLEAGEFKAVVEAISRSDLEDVAAAYVISTVRLVHLWLIWEDKCRGLSRYRSAHGENSVCSEIELFMKSRGAGGMGVATYFNTEVKEILSKMYVDLAPGILVPSWILNYISRVDPSAAAKLRELSIEQQVGRLPVFAAAAAVLDAAVKALLDHYGRKGSDFAYAVAGYVYWEIVRPYSFLSEVLANNVLRCNSFKEVYGEVYTSTSKLLSQDDVKPLRASYTAPIRKLAGDLRAKLLELIKRARLNLAQ